MKCAACGFENRPNIKFCENCGATLPEVISSPAAGPPPPSARFCPNCGGQIRPGARFCEACGAGLQGIPASPPAAIYAVPPAANRPGSKVGCIFLGILLALLGMVGLGVGAYFLFFYQGDFVIRLPAASQTAAVAPPAAPAPTQEAQPTYTPLPTYTFPPPPTNTPIPPPTLTFTPAIPTFIASQPTNCRSGPANAYSIRTGINQGEEVQITGRSAPEWGLWYQVVKQGVTCWVYGPLGETRGNVNNLPVVAAPPTPTATRTQPPPVASLMIYNNLNVSICYAYVALSSAPDWGPDRLGTSIIPPGGSFQVTGLPAGIYDIRLEDCSNNVVCSGSNVNLSGNMYISCP
ncbi:MAG: zinc ribbon domain-containing protein [Anaerolineales bacterium]|nr:zinc ribbon domain-containing protein [Anaerolineales bacterium]